MNRIIEILTKTSSTFINNRVIGGVATIEGRIWTVHRNNRVFRTPIIASDQNSPVNQPVIALQNLERGPTGHHDLIVGQMTSDHQFPSVQLLYCHQIVCEVNSGGYVTVCGRTHLMFMDIKDDTDSGDDETKEYELKSGQHMNLIRGTIRVKASASGHRIYLNDCVKYEIFSQNN